MKRAPKPGWGVYHKLGVEMSKQMPHYFTLREVAQFLGVSRPGANAIANAALGKVVYRLRAALEEDYE